MKPIALLVASLLLIPSLAVARDTVQIAGSSTVLPFASIVAEEFGLAYPDFKTPVVGSGGTGGGLKQFCEGIGDSTIDIANASRKIKDGELATCNTNGVTDVREIQFGFDGIVFASAKNPFELNPTLVYKAIAAQVWDGTQFVDNPYRNWHDIDASLPDQPIALAIPASNHGTREVFQEKVITAGCKAVGVPEDLQEEACTKYRQDVVMEISGDYTETLARIQADPNVVGVFGLSFYEENMDRLTVATFEGVTPTHETIASGEYAVSRPLFFYVKGQHLGVVPGLREYVEFFLTEEMIGPGGALEDQGLIVQPDDITQTQRETIEQ